MWVLCMFRHYLVVVTFEVFTDHYALQWLKTMKTELMVLHCWCQEIEEFDFVVEHWPVKLQSHIDALSHLPTSPAKRCVAIHLPTEVMDELQEWYEKTQEGVPGHQGAVSVGGYSFDSQGHIRVGPKVACHFVEVLLHSTAGHLGA